jgi:hypothetical protein
VAVSLFVLMVLLCSCSIGRVFVKKPPPKKAKEMTKNNKEDRKNIISKMQ